MITLKSLPVSPEAQLRQLDWSWMLGRDTLPYLTNDVVLLNGREAEAYRDAANQLYDMFVETGQDVIDNQRFAELGIPENLIELIKLTWDDDRHFHLYGRFDLSGGVDGKPIKLIEFNADTATCIPETAVVQWAHLKANNLDESLQFNSLYESLTENFRALREMNSDLEPALLLSALRDTPEDDTNVAVLAEAAREAGFEVAIRYVDEVEFSAEEGIFIHDEQGGYEQFFFWFKLLPWEYIALDEPELAATLTQIVKKRQAVIINPAYALLFQSKGFLKLLWDRFAFHPLLLQTDVVPLSYKDYVEKVMFGREGANVRIMDVFGKVLEEAGGDYGDYPKVYQEYTDFVQDDKGNHYQAGVFFTGGACALGFRRGGKIIDNTAQFTGHMIDYLAL
ncbi:MAG: glutathionylspermidine synthase family protein [Ferruginibacter sp.]|nr:glutathionylspermidine synthase family protein [Cytophagales bacterium]